MDKQTDMSGMLEMLPHPAFFVKKGIITQANQAACQLQIQPKTPIDAILGNNTEEYHDFDGGCLCLTLILSGCPMLSSVTRMDGFDLFTIDQAAEQAELKAMALTATNFREPLSDIIALKEQLLPDSSDPLIQNRIGQMNRRLTQLHRMVCNMADALQFATDAIPRMECQDVCAMTEEILERAAVLAEKAGFRLTYQVPREAIISMIARDRLERAIYNILSNAMKNSPPGSTIEAKLSHRGKKLYLSIQDNGPGIPPHLLGSLYGRYRRQPGIEAQPTGVGLGMVLVRGTAAAHGGAVLIDQPEGKGTRITMSLAIQTIATEMLRSNVMAVDYAGEYDHGLLELSDVLPPELYI